MSKLSDLIIEALQNPQNTFDSDGKSALIMKMRHGDEPFHAHTLTDAEKVEVNRILAANGIGLVIS